MIKILDMAYDIYFGSRDTDICNGDYRYYIVFKSIKYKQNPTFIKLTTKRFLSLTLSSKEFYRYNNPKIQFNVSEKAETFFTIKLL